MVSCSVRRVIKRKLDLTLFYSLRAYCNLLQAGCFRHVVSFACELNINKDTTRLPANIEGKEGPRPLGLTACLKMTTGSLPFFRACLRSYSAFLQLSHEEVKKHLELLYSAPYKCKSQARY